MKEPSSSESPFIAEPFPPAASSPGASGRVSVSVPTKEDGSPDWERASEKVKAKFKTILEDPSTQAQFVKLAPEGQMDPVQAQMLGQWAINLMFQVQGMVAAVRFKLTRDEIQSLFRPDFSPYPGFNDALARVMQKRGPEFLARWGDEIMVSGCMILCSLGAWSQASDFAKQKEGAAREAKEKGNGEVKPSAPLPVPGIENFVTQPA